MPWPPQASWPLPGLSSARGGCATALARAAAPNEEDMACETGCYQRPCDSIMPCCTEAPGFVSEWRLDLSKFCAFYCGVAAAALFAKPLKSPGLKRDTLLGLGQRRNWVAVSAPLLQRKLSYDSVLPFIFCDHWYMPRLGFREGSQKGRLHATMLRPYLAACTCGCRNANVTQMNVSCSKHFSRWRTVIFYRQNGQQPIRSLGIPTRKASNLSEVYDNPWMSCNLFWTTATHLGIERTVICITHLGTSRVAGHETLRGGVFGVYLKHVLLPTCLFATIFYKYHSATGALGLARPCYFPDSRPGFWEAFSVLSPDFAGCDAQTCPNATQGASRSQCEVQTKATARCKLKTSAVKPSFL